MEGTAFDTGGGGWEITARWEERSGGLSCWHRNGGGDRGGGNEFLLKHRPSILQKVGILFQARFFLVKAACDKHQFILWYHHS